MNNCLVTKYKRSAQNDNLPIFGKIIIEIPQMEQTPSNGFMIVASAPDASVNMKLVNSTFIDGFATKGNTATIAPNILKVGHITVTNNDQRVILDVYNVRSIQSNNATKIIGLESLNYGAPKRISVGNALDAVDMPKLKNIECIFSMPSASDEAIQIFMDNNRETLVWINTRLTSAVINTLPKLSGALVNNTTIENLPSRLNYLNFGSYCTGSVNTLIDNWRNAGRTSGKIHTPWLANSVGTTIDTGSGSVSTKQWCIDHNITAGQNVYLSWDANSLTITNDATGAAQYPMTNNLVV